MLVKDFFYSLFFRHFCMSSPNKNKPLLQNPIKGKGFEKTHYFDFQTQDFEKKPHLLENDIFILEKAFYKILAFYQKFSFKKEENYGPLLFDQNLLVLRLSFNGLFDFDGGPFILDWVCPDFLQDLVRNPCNNTKNELVLQLSTCRFAYIMDVFLLDLRNSIYTGETLLRLVKTGLYSAESLVIITDIEQDIRDFVECFDTVFLDNVLFK